MCSIFAVSFHYEELFFRQRFYNCKPSVVHWWLRRNDDDKFALDLIDIARRNAFNFHIIHSIKR